jgi:SAM-dependent methyltransferase
VADSILFSAPAERNRRFILEVIRPQLSGRRSVLEIASGTGQHITHFAAALPGLYWQPSDPDPNARASIAARVEAEGLTNVADPLALDLLEDWPELSFDAVITANLLHISEPEVLPALMKKAADILSTGGLLHIYGPFRVQGDFTSPSNAEFDASLKSRNPRWGIRDLEAVTRQAVANELSEPIVRDMPANNFSLTLFRT